MSTLLEIYQIVNTNTLRLKLTISVNPSRTNSSRAQCPKTIFAARNVSSSGSTLQARHQIPPNLSYASLLTRHQIPLLGPPAPPLGIARSQAEAFGVYFFQSSMFRVLTREGIRPKRKSPQGRSSLLKVLPTDTLGPIGSSQLRGRSDACLLIDMHASLKSGGSRRKCERAFFFLHCRAHHYSSDGHEVGKKTTTSRHRGEPPKTKQTQKRKPKTNKNQTTPTKRLPKKARTRVKRCETCENATLKLSNVLLQEVVPNKVRRSVQRCSVSNYLLCIYHTSRSISEKVASSRSGLLSFI